MRCRPVFTAFVLLVLIVVAASSSPAETRRDPYRRYLTPADVAGVTGRRVAATRARADGYEFLAADGRVFLTVRFASRSAFAAFQKDLAEGIAKPVRGLGDRAVYALPDLPYLVAFRRAGFCVTLTTSCLGIPLSFPQLVALAGIIAGRI